MLWGKEARYELKGAARVVGIGAGIVGRGVADHPAQVGRRSLPNADGGPLLWVDCPQVALASPCSVRGSESVSFVGGILGNLVTDAGIPTTLPYSAHAAVRADPDDLFAGRRAPRPGARRDIQTP